MNVSDGGELLYFEDLQPGDVWHSRPHTISEEEIVDFSKQYDPLPFHIDRDAADAFFFKGLIASGWHTVAISSRQLCECLLLHAACIGSPGVEQIR